MKSFDAQALAPESSYKLLSGSVLPRPIAWVSTVDAHDRRNLAPYSFFTVASANPPVLCFCPSVREAKDGLRATKDTLENIRATGEFVVNIVSEELVEPMNRSAPERLKAVGRMAGADYVRTGDRFSLERPK